MTKSRRVLLIAALAALSITPILVLWPSGGEPEYEGNQLSAWLGPRYLGSSSISDQDKAQAIEAIRRIGTNGLPCLLEWVAYETPARTKTLCRTFDRGPLKILQRALLDSDQQKYIRGGRAVTAFQILGPAAAPAIVDLNRILTNRAAINASTRARDCLRFIGCDALPSLLATATNSQTPWRDRLPMAIAYVAKQSGEAASVVPVLADLLKDQDAKVAGEAAAALGYIGAQPQLAVPALVKAAQERRATVRCAALSALGDFGTHARPAIPMLIRCLDDDSFEVQMSAMRALGTLRLEPKLVVPALTTCVKESAKPVPAYPRQALAVLALGRYGKAAESAVPVILPLLDDSHLELRRSATNALKEIAPEKVQVTNGK